MLIPLVAAVATGQQFSAAKGTKKRVLAMRGNMNSRLAGLNVTATSPSENALNVARMANVSATFDSMLNQSTVTAQSFKVRGANTAGYSGAISFPTASSAQLNPTNDFRAGELLTVALSSAIQSSGGMNLMPYLWQFWAAVTPSSGQMIPHPTTPSFGADNSYSIVLGDIDGDGDLDVLVANFTSAETVWLNGGSGNFSPHPTTPSFEAGTCYDFALGDLDGDGDLDAVAANIGAGAETVWLNDGSGNFSAHPTTPSFGAGASFAVVLGDLDGDGDLDAVVANYAGQAETVWLNNGSGSFSPHPTAPAFGAGQSTDIGLGDIDGDGDLDVVLANAGPSADEPETVWLNNGSGVFTPHPTTPSFGAGDSEALALGDIDGDGDLDAVVANDLDPKLETVWLNNGSGSFSPHPTTPTFGGGQSFDIALGDLDGDGDLDAVVANFGGLVEPETVWLNNGSGVFTPHPTTPAFGANASLGIALGDIDRDGDLDAVVANINNEEETVWLNNKNGTTVSLLSSANPSVFGQAVTFTATVEPVGPGGTPTGTVTFTIDGTPQTPVTLNVSGQASFTTSALTVAGSPHAINVNYNGDANYNTSSGGLSGGQTVNKAHTVTVITGDTPDPSIVGQAVTVNFTVSPIAPGAGTLTGNVTVRDGVDSCTGTAAAGSCMITLTTPGNRTIEATYVGDSNFIGSMSAGVPHQVADTTAPMITCPANQVGVTNISTPNTAVPVSYPAPTVSGGSTVVCMPPSGLNFPLGTTTVNCTATDAASNTASCSFTVTVHAPRAAINDLKKQVQALVPPLTQAGQLISTLAQAANRAERGQLVQACGELQTFVNRVTSFVINGQLTMAQGQSLLSYANKIRNALNCAGGPFAAFRAETVGVYLAHQKWEVVSHFLMMGEPKKFNDSVTAFLVKNRLIGYK